MSFLGLSVRAASSLAGLLICLSCTTAPGAEAQDDARSRQLEEVLAAFNEDVRAPAWAAAVVEDGQIVAVAGVGVRDIESGAALNVETDMLHWGSVTKSVTATMIAGVVADGALSWDTTLAEVFPDTPMRDEYRAVTIAGLMNHRADLPPYTRLGPAEGRRFAAYAGTPLEKRGQFVREVLLEEPPVRADNALIYSNAGPAVAAHAAEVATGQSWEDLVRQHVFEPIGMSSAGFGMPYDADHPDQTRGHIGPDADNLTVLRAGPMPASPMIDPAGNSRSTVRDFALYARAHLLGLKGEDGPLDVDAVRTLHTAPDDGRTIGPRSGSYAMGWGLRREGEQIVHWHNGSAGAFFAQADIFPDDDLAIVVMANAGFAGRSAPELIARIRSLYVE